MVIIHVTLTFSFEHGAGVVSILPISENHVLTGSYDDNLRVYDFRNLKKHVSRINLDGGVWRILQRPQSSTSFLTCCMQPGARTITLDPDTLSVTKEIAFEPEEETRLIYGGSWQNENVAALCSFYEKKLYICRIP
jgi:diphthamide biosynthesis protein 7